MRKRDKKEKKQKGNNRLGIKAVMKAELPAAIKSRLSPLFTTGSAVAASGVLLLLIPSLRTMSPYFVLLGLVIAGYAFWQKRDVIKKGWDEYVFKVMDYTYIARVLTRMQNPTGMLLLNEVEENSASGNIYHVATSGKARALPPIDWYIRVYVPKGSEAVAYGDRKYFPVVYGYSIEGDGK